MSADDIVIFVSFPNVCELPERPFKEVIPCSWHTPFMAKHPADMLNPFLAVEVALPESIRESAPKSPCTANLAKGVVVPIPTLLFEFIVMAEIDDVAYASVLVAI